LLAIRLSPYLPMSWNGVGHVCTLFALWIDHSRAAPRDSPDALALDAGMLASFVKDGL
jgi:hypothetical protein